ncbi:sodium- and chloride-dependent glycine transporter 2-like [Watersipora subatra]|uniref:sodium- and chloride-dependent glycine transporter 2-like n=1 Tax=Watersipora subatra TaxID=2589382 RepID=UPI00355B8A5F
MVRIQPSLAGTIEGDENLERGNWSRQLDFLLSCLGYAVGLGNVWRFPHLSYTNGGGAFFIPYLLMAIFVGMPIFLMELAIGQYCSAGPVTAFRFCPLFTGIGMGMVTVTALVCTYYNVIIAWAIYYLIVSFQRALPWSHCKNEWNTPFCSDLWPSTECSGANETKMENGTCYRLLDDGHDQTNEFLGLYDTEVAALFNIKPVLSSEEYFFKKVLNVSPGINDIGTINPGLLGCLIGAWALVYLALFQGVKSSGKVVYFTALFPYFVLVILLINGLTLKGAGNGIKFYLRPDWPKLLESKVWSNAGSQIFFSLSICWGGLITLASYNRFRNNIIKDTLVVTIGNSLTSIFAGFVIYSYIGHLADRLGVEVDKVSDGGTGLAFIIFPAAILTLPFPPFWSVLFFVMLLTLGLDSQFTLLETVTTMLFDLQPSWRSKKPWITLACVLIFLMPGVLMTSQGGIYIFDLIDSYAAGFNVIILCLFELFTVMVLYGKGNNFYSYKRFTQDIKLMIGKDLSPWWRFCWQVAGPLILSRLKDAIRPNPRHGPALSRYRALVDYVPGFLIHPSAELLAPRMASNENIVVQEVSHEMIKRISLNVPSHDLAVKSLLQGANGDSLAIPDLEDQTPPKQNTSQ